MGMTAGVLIFVALYNFARSLASGAVSIVAPVFRLSFAITVALAVWLLDEPLTGWKLAGLAASLAAVWLLLAGAPASSPRATLSSVLRVLVATVAMGIVTRCTLAPMARGSPSPSTGRHRILAIGDAVTSARDHGFHPPPGAWRHGATAAVAAVWARCCRGLGAR